MTQRLTREQAAIIGAFTGITCGPISDLHEKIEQLMGHPVWTHELASPELWKLIKERAKQEFIALCATDDKP